MALFDRLGRLLRGAPPPQARSADTPVVSLFAPAAAPVEKPALRSARAGYFRLRTGRATLLAVAGGRVDMVPAGYEAQALIAIVPDANRQLCFLAAPDGRAFDVRGDGMLAVCVSAFRVQAQGGGIKLRHPLSPVRFMAATMPGQGAPDGCVIFDSLGRGKLDLFTEEALERGDVPQSVQALAAEICAAVARPYRAAPVLDLLRSLSIRPALAEPLLRVLPRDELALLARDLLERRADLDLLAEVLPDNSWAQRYFPELAAWHKARAGVQPDGIMHSPAAEEFANDPFEALCQPQVGFVLTALARASIIPRRGACIIAAARNEGPYLLDWLAYHRAIGFEHFFIYTNDNSDGSGALLEALARGGAITLVHNEPGTHTPPQYKAYAHALSLLPQPLDYRWAALIDVDEYIGFDAGMFAGIDDFLAWHETQPVDVIALCWMMFVAGRGDTWRDESVPARFVQREPHVNQHVKSIIRPHKFWTAQAHYPFATLNAPVVFRTEDGGVHHHLGVTDRIPAFAASPTANIAWIAHYWLRSAPEALWKVARGPGDWKDRVAARHLEIAQRMFRGFVSLADRTDLVEDRRMLACAPGHAAALAALRALPGVADLDDSIRGEFGARLDRMARAFVENAPADGEPAEFAPFREVLRQLVLK